MMNRTHNCKAAAAIICTVLLSTIAGCEEPPTGGAGDGSILFYQCAVDQTLTPGEIEVYLDGEEVTTIRSYFTDCPPNCDASHENAVVVDEGWHTLTARTAGYQWEDEILIEGGECMTYRLAATPDYGSISFWSRVGDEGDIAISVDGGATQYLSYHYTSGDAPEWCGESASLTMTLAAGSHSYTAYSNGGSNWQGSFTITSDGCLLYELWN